MRLEETEIVINAESGKKPNPDNDAEETDQQDEESAKEASAEPQIFLLSSGEITPEFEIRLYILGIETSYIINGLFDGTLSSAVSDI